MIVLLARIVLALAGLDTEANHERAHCACEEGAYALVAPEARFNALAELIAEIACRNDPMWR